MLQLPAYAADFAAYIELDSPRLTAMKRYSSPDWIFFAKNTVGLTCFLVFLNWIPEMAAWLHSAVWNETLTMDLAKFQRVLYAAYTMAGLAVFIHLAGLLWAVWHNAKGRP